ncbi:MAG: patatin-like phospholipase family protein [Chitinispirillaceae bacterium]|nr:patatin-like phospholipase family protein [Chitinispirillaceae bacterium]
MHRFRVNKYTARSVIVAAILLSSGFLPRPVAADYQCALVLSGGGARGFAQIGVLKAFDSLGIRPDLIVATSIGAIIGGLYASGFSADSIASLARSVDWNSIYRNSSPRRSLFVLQKEDPYNALLELRFNRNLSPILPNAVSHGQAFYDLLTPLLIVPQFRANLNFNDLAIPLRILATDLMTGRKTVIDSGNIVTAIRASCAVPLAFTPVELDGRLLADGGIAENIPTATAIEAGARNIILIDVTSPLWKKEDLEHPVKLVDQIVSISRMRSRRKEDENAQLIIRPDLGSLKNNEFDKIDSFISVGFQTTLAMREELLALSDDASGSRKNLRNRPSRHRESTADPDLQGISDATALLSYPVTGSISIKGNRKTRNHIVLNASGLSQGDTLDGPATRRILSSLYATDLFENVNIDVDSSGVTRIQVEEKKYLRARFGLRFDDFHLGEGFIEPAYENCFGIGMIALMHLHYGLRREKYTIELLGNHLFTRNFSTNLQFQLFSSKEKIREIDTVYDDSTRMVSTVALHEHTLRKTGMNFYIGTQVGRFSLLTGGLRLERFLVQRSDADMLRDLFGVHFKKTLPTISLKLTMDSMDRYPFPTTGMKLYLSLSASGRAFGGGYSFIKYAGSLGRYFTFFNIHTVHPMLSFSWATNALPEVERAYLGGVLYEERYREMSLHNYIPFIGLPPRTLIGDRFAIAHLEYRCMIKKNIFAHILFDWGSAWNYNNYDFNELSSEAPIGAGIGFSYQTILGPIRVLYGQLLKNSKYYLSDQTEFFYFSAGYDF